MHARNGQPVLLDQYGNPYRRDGSARPGGIALPHGLMFVSKYQGGGNTYLHQLWDEALKAGREEAIAMRRDLHLRGLLQERMLAVASLPWHLEVPDEKDPYQTRVRDGMTRLMKGVRSFRRMVWWWLEAIWYGRYGVQVEWEWCDFHDHPNEAPKAETSLPTGPASAGSSAGKLRRGITIAQSWGINGDKIGHQYDHTPYVLMNSADVKNIPGAETIVTSVGGHGLLLTGDWLERILIHKHWQEDADFFDSSSAEAIHGVGLRSIAYWFYWLKMQWLGDVTDFFDRVGLGVTIWKYPRGSAEGLAQVKAAANAQSERAHIFVPVDPDDVNKAGTGIDRMEVPTSGADALVRLIEYADKIIERYFVGQEASSSGSSSGLGNEANAAFQMDTKAKITMSDAALLAETLTGSAREPGLLSIAQKYSFPEADFPVRWVFDVERAESEKKVQSGKTMVELGVDIKADELRAAAGFSKPAQGDELVKPPQQPGAPGAPGGMPGAPGADGADVGQDPLAALMGGGAGPGAEDAGQPGEEQAQPGAEEGAPGESAEPVQAGNFLEALRHSRDRLARAVRHLRQRGRSDLAAQLVAAHGRKVGRKAP